jgi:hypothetical protein
MAQSVHSEGGQTEAVHDDPPLDEWQFETVEHVDGTVRQGLILAEGETEIELFEILRPPGKPMFAVIRPIQKEEITAIQRLEKPQRQRLIERVDSFRRRARIEAGRMEDVELRQEIIDQATRWIYDGTWFRLESTTDEQLTRRCIVRIEQIFRAYRQILPPRVQPSGRLLIELFGTMDQYRRRVHQSGLDIVHPAFFCSVENRIVAGSDLNAYAQRLRDSQAHHAQVRREYRTRHQAFPSTLSAVLDELRRLGYGEAEIELESRLRRSVWQREYDTAMARIDSVERRNQARFAEVTQQMFAMLYHEAFHAYVQNYVLPASPSQMPRWLNEGLAQIFETAQLDGDTLRIDAPDVARLRALQSDLSGPEPLRIAQVLEAPDDHFLDSFQGDTAERLYLYAWGIAYYLTYEQDLLGTKRLDEFLANPEKFGPVARFTKLTGTPLASFEAAWQAAMRNLKPYTTPE